MENPIPTLGPNVLGMLIFFLTDISKPSHSFNTPELADEVIQTLFLGRYDPCYLLPCFSFDVVEYLILSNEKAHEY